MELVESVSERSDMKPKQAKKNPAARALGRLGGLANTAKQNRARARNAKKAGRPGRVCVKCAKPVLGGHVDRALDDSCGQHGWRWERAGVSVAAPVGPERKALDAIAAALTGVEWDADTCAAVAAILRGTGRVVSEVA
jgi:hypothetical protein